ncbi:MAG: spore cortex biosynthesis protein YabQ [Clostridia bacterium]|mgnify:FL=1|nr:spore cortex biosynthesis protein YabQ [Clostridia bacterium]
MENQAYLFGIFILNGFLIGLLFDIFRILRKSFKTADFITYLQDILFWIITGFIILYSIFKFNNGELRGFIFIGIFCGVLTYMLIFSKIFIKINLSIINFFKKAIHFVIIVPVLFISKFLKKIIFKPISFLIINLRKSLSKFILKIKNLFFNKKKNNYKKDFT